MQDGRTAGRQDGRTAGRQDGGCKCYSKHALRVAGGQGSAEQWGRRLRLRPYRTVVRRGHGGVDGAAAVVSGDNDVLDLHVYVYVVEDK